MHRIPILLLTFAGACLPQVEADTASAKVSIQVSTTFGERIPEAQVLIKEVGPAAQYKKSGAQLRFKLPFGKYVIQASAAGFLTSSETVGIYQRDVFYRLGLAVAPPHSSERTEISGAIAPPPPDITDVWVRLLPVYTGGLIETQPDKSGGFHLVGIEPGRYVMLLFDKGRLLESKEVHFLGGKLTANLDLKK